LTPDLAKRLARAYPGLSMPATGVAHVAGVAEVARDARKPQQIRPLRPLRPEIDKGAKAKGEGVATARDAVADAIEERRAIIGDTCPAPYTDTFARLNNQKPSAVSTEDWERAVNDGGGLSGRMGRAGGGIEMDGGRPFRRTSRRPAGRPCLAFER